MVRPDTRFMEPSDWRRQTIPQGFYFNKQGAITGYQTQQGGKANALHPVCTFEDQLRAKFREIQTTCPHLKLSRHHFKMPYWAPSNHQLPTNYSVIERPERLTSTSVTLALAPNPPTSGQPELGYHFNGKELPSLRDRLAAEGESKPQFTALIGNIGYYMTANLIHRERVAWSHNQRYPRQFHLPTLKSYLGFHLTTDTESGEVKAGFQGAHPAAVGIHQSGKVEIMPQLQITGYRISVNGQELRVSTINPHATEGKKAVLFTPGFQSAEVHQHQTTWQSYAPFIPISTGDKRVNLFIANEGNGQVPREKVIRIWHERAPLPSFGGILSLSHSYYKELFPQLDSHELVNQPVQICPYGKNNFNTYTQILGGLVPVVVDGQHLYDVKTVPEIQTRLQQHANVGSPIAEAGRESRNFDLQIREPAGVLVQTRDQLGWVLFDGRHELSIGASVVDVARLLKRLESSGAFGAPLLHAAFVDGGSAMKVYAAQINHATITLKLLNRVAAGSRNGSGVDPDGLNLYTTLKLPLNSQKEINKRSNKE